MRGLYILVPLDKKYRRMLKTMSLTEAAEAPREWSVYIARCGDDSFYTGIAKDVTARLKQHNSGRGAAYTRSRRPVALAYAEPGLTRSQALSREAQIKS